MCVEMARRCLVTTADQNSDTENGVSTPECDGNAQSLQLYGVHKEWAAA